MTSMDLPPLSELRGSRPACCMPVSLAVPVLVTLAFAGAWAQERPPPELTLPRVTVVGVDTVRISGVKAELPVIGSMPLAPLPAWRAEGVPIAAWTSTGESGRGRSLLVSAMAGPARTLYWHVGGEQRQDGLYWSARASRAASREADLGLGSWWRERVAASGGGQAHADLRWQRLGYRSHDRIERVTMARPWVEWSGHARARVGWAGGSREGSWRDAWWVDAELPLRRDVRLTAQGQTRAGVAACATGDVVSDVWQLHMGVGSLVTDDGEVEWLAAGRGCLQVAEASSVWMAGRRRAVFREPYSLLLDGPYTAEEEDDWSWTELREEAELGAAFSYGLVEGEACAGAWRGWDHPQWESEQRCVRVDAKGATLGLRARWRAGVLQAEGTVARLFTDVIGQEERLYYTPNHRWSVRVGVHLGPAEFAVLADGAGARPTGSGELGSFVRAGFEAYVRLTTGVSLTARGTNLFDEDYELWEGYPMPTSRLVVGIEINL
jgi:hypothetical protein